MLRRGGLLAAFGIWLAGHVSDLRARMRVSQQREAHSVPRRHTLKIT
jgi:hypothetical protein